MHDPRQVNEVDAGGPPPDEQGNQDAEQRQRQWLKDYAPLKNHPHYAKRWRAAKACQDEGFVHASFCSLNSGFQWVHNEPIRLIIAHENGETRYDEIEPYDGRSSP